MSSCGRAALFALLGGVVSSLATAAPRVRVVSDRALTGPAATANDIRWSPAGSIYLATMPAGVLEIDPAGEAPPKVAFPTSRGKCQTCTHLAASKRYIATAFPAFSIAWKRLGDATIEQSVFDVIVDLDLRDDHLLLLGSRREDERWAPDGAIAWTGTLRGGLSDLRPVLYSALGPEAKILGECGFTALGAARYLRDGSFVIVPGVEPGVYLYGADGKLLHTWQTDRLGILDRCDLSKEARLLYARDPEARYQWLNRWRVVNDVVPLAAGPALLIREVAAHKTQWSLLVLHREGPPTTIALPFSADSDVAVARADVRNGRIAFLIRTYGEWRPEFKTPPARLVIAELQ